MQDISKAVGFKGDLSFGNIAFGILAEILIYKDLTDYLYSDPNKKMAMVGQKFKYNLVIGDYDQGFDFIKNQNEIDVKHYGTHICKNLEEILKYQLLIDQKQYNNHQADIYIQSFTMINNNKPYIVIAGYATKSQLTLNKSMQNPAYSCKVVNLLTYHDLKTNYF